MRILRKTDIVLIAFFIILAFSLFFVFIFMGPTAGSVARVTIDGEEVLSIDIAANEGKIFNVVSSYGLNVLSVENGRIRMIDADCPDGVCLRMGAISNTFQTITCLPHRLVVELTGSTNPSHQESMDIIVH